jgi:cyclopropane-fatty-acyl-phospholipid synthase
MPNSREYIKRVLEPANIRINGDRPWDIRVHNDHFYSRVIRNGSVGLGESYMDGWWDAECLDRFFYHLLKSGIGDHIKLEPAALFLFLKSILNNQQKKSRAYQIGERHYDIGNDLYQIMLDRRMVYTCGWWQDAQTLDEAQEAKLDLVCRKLGLRSGQRVLDIGCGWGSFAKYAAENYGAEVVGITVSRRQVEMGNKLCRGLPVEIRLQDYRDLNETFDHIVSLGMIEHVGYKNYRTYFQVVQRCLRNGGSFVLQTIGSNYPVRTTDPWIQKYIFPNSMVPSLSQLGRAFERLLVMEDWHNFGPDYDKTLMAWHDNVQSGLDTLKERYSGRFLRMWTYYLLMSAGSFRARKNQLWQIVFSKEGRPDGFRLPKYSRDYSSAVNNTGKLINR